MKIKREILAFFLAILLFPLTCGFAFADLNVGDYSLGGYLEMGGGFLANYPNVKNTGYLVKYSPFPVGPLGGVDLTLKSKDELEYYRFRMSNPGFSANQDYLLEMGKLGVWHVQAEYDQFQHVYSTVNNYNNDIGILIQRFRFSGDYLVTPEIDLFIEDQWLRRTGQQPLTYEAGPSTPYEYTATALRPIGYSQNDAKVGAEYASKTFQFRVGYHLSTFQDDNSIVKANTANFASFESLPASNMANYITAEGGANLAAYKTRITGSFSYGWLSQDGQVYSDFGNVYTGGTSAPQTGLGLLGDAGLTASTVAGDISGVTRPTDQWSLRYSYRAYGFDNNNLNNPLVTQVLLQGVGLTAQDRSLMQQEQYSYLKQTMNLGTDYKVNDMVALEAAYTFSATDRTENQGNTTSNSPKFGIRLFPTSWLNLIANYTYSERLGNDFLSVSANNILTYKFYAGDDRRNAANFIAEAFPLNNVTFSANFSFYRDDFNDSNAYGLLNDQGWSLGADVSWTPTPRIALALGYDHQGDITKDRAVFTGRTSPVLPSTTTSVIGDPGPILSTMDSYDTFTAKADFKLIPDKLKFTAGASYSFSTSKYDTPMMPTLWEGFADLSAGLNYRFNEHWGCSAIYRYEIFEISKAYQILYQQGTSATGAPVGNQALNTLDGFYRNATASAFELFVQYKF